MEEPLEEEEGGGRAAGDRDRDWEGPVQIRVAAAPDAAVDEEDEEEEEEEEEDERRRARLSLPPLSGGSCSEDDSGRCGGGKSSGGENDGDDLGHNWNPPEHDLILKLVAQIEYYFSDENLEKDAFLLKHVRRNKMGYVSVKLLTSFKKVKHLTRDWRITAYALKYSNTLELNEDNRKVRRNTPVPVFPSENLPSKMLLVYDIGLVSDLHCPDGMQENGCTQEKVMEQLLKAFVKFGVISSVRILKPGRDLPPDIKRFSSRYSQVGTQECAIVEFEEVDAAIKAHETMCITDKAAGMKVVLIGMKPPKKKVAKEKNRDEESAKGLSRTRTINKRVEELQYLGEESSANSSSEPESNQASPMSGRRSGTANKLSPSAYPNNHLSPNVSPRSSPWNSPSSLRRVSRMSPLAEDGRLSLSASPETQRRCVDYSSDSSITPSSSPWVQRRRQAQTLTQEKSPGAGLVTVEALTNQLQPKAPINKYAPPPFSRVKFWASHNGHEHAMASPYSYRVVPPYAIAPDYSHHRPYNLYIPSPIVDNSGFMREGIKHRKAMILDRTRTEESDRKWEEKWINYVTVVNSVKPWRTAGKPFVCDRLWLWTS